VVIVFWLVTSLFMVATAFTASGTIGGSRFGGILSSKVVVAVTESSSSRVKAGNAQRGVKH
jgi:hypothetical protein